MKWTAAILLSAAPLHAAENARVEFAFGVLAECRGDEAGAEVRFENARKLDPQAGPLVKRGVSRLLAAGDRAGAISLYREYAAARPDDLDVQLGYADFLTEQGGGDALARKLAVQTLDAALAKHSGHPEVVRRLFSLDRSRGAALMETLSAEDPAAVLLYASLSRSLHDADDAEARGEVDRRFQSAMEAHPENPALAREASEHFRNSNRAEQAIGVLKRHTEAAPWSLDLRVRMGVLCFTAKRDQEGEAALKEVLAIDPRNALAHQALAKRYRLDGKQDLAAYHAGELLKIRGGSPEEFLKLAGGHLAADRPREARLLLEKAVFDHPENTDLRVKLAIATLRDTETRSRAPRLFREAEAAFPEGKITDPEFLTASAEAMIEAGQSKAAEERLRAAIRAWPADAKKETAAALRRLAELWQKENRNAEAAKALLLRADGLDPK